MDIKRIVSTGFWTDNKVIERFSVEDKYFMLYLLTNPHTTQLGIYELSLRQASFELGYSKDVLEILLDRFEKEYKIIKYSSQTKEIAVGNYLRHSIVKGGKPVEDLLKKEIAKVKDRSLLSYSFSKIRDYDDLNETVLKILDSFESNNTNENDNDNDNDDSSSVRTTNRTPYAEIEKLYNEICVSYPNLTKLSESRKKAIKARLKTYSVDDFKKLFIMAEESKFLKGQNNKNWSATFDWLIKDGNMAKVLDGNYYDKGVNNVGLRKPAEKTSRTETITERAIREGYGTGDIGNLPFLP